ncbi:unnamed protein product, partial [marine sediment metagenome]
LHDKESVSEAFCELAGRVNEAVYGWSYSSDCFCAIGDDHPKFANFQWSTQVFDFIAEAVMAAVRTEQEVQQRIRIGVMEATGDGTSEQYRQPDTTELQERIDELEAQIAMSKLP